MKPFPAGAHQKWLDAIGYENTVCERCDEDVGNPDLLDNDNLCEYCREKDEHYGIHSLLEDED